METIEKKIFESLPGNYLLLDPAPGYIILDATDAYLKITQRERDIIGQPLFEVFPDNPGLQEATGVENLTRSLEQVWKTGKPHHMGIQRYDTRIPGSDSFLTRYWNPLNVPVCDGQDRVRYIIHSVEEVTRQVLLKNELRNMDQQMQQQIADAVSTTQEMERLEISRELHDNINQILITARFYLGRAMDRPVIDKDMAQAALELLEKSVAEVKKISRALQVTSTQEENLVHALEELIGQVLSYGPVNIKRSIVLPDESLIESKVKVTILRIVQEQLANVIKHSEAKNVFIGITFDNGILSLTIRDDGKGFHLSEKKGGMGFQNMKSRVALMDGSMHIESSPGDGCTIHVNIPVTAPQHLSYSSGHQRSGRSV